MATSSFTFADPHPLPAPSFGSQIKSIITEVGNFIYEMPLWVVAAAVAGVAFIVFYPSLAAPCFGISGAAVLCRIAVKIIDAFDTQYLKSFNEKMYEFQQKYPYIQYLSFLVAAVVAVFCPIGGFCFAVGVGVYKGVIVEIEVIKYKQIIRREEWKNPPPMIQSEIVNC